ncbi:hypothetical protein BDR22DRAFT_975900 [Usnea florida]
MTQTTTMTESTTTTQPTSTTEPTTATEPTTTTEPTATTQSTTTTEPTTTTQSTTTTEPTTTTQPSTITKPTTRTQPLPKIHLHRFTCGHTQSYYRIIVPPKSVLNLPHPCFGCEPMTQAGQDRLEILYLQSESATPFMTHEGDIVFMPRGSRNDYPYLIVVREKEGWFGGRVVRTDSAEGMSQCAVFGVVRGGG